MTSGPFFFGAFLALADRIACARGGWRSRIEVRRCRYGLSCALSFLGSSTVEHPAVNRRVAGSNPARGANLYSNLE